MCHLKSLHSSVHAWTLRGQKVYAKVFHFILCEQLKGCKISLKPYLMRFFMLNLVANPNEG